MRLEEQVGLWKVLEAIDRAWVVFGYVVPVCDFVLKYYFGDLVQMEQA